jgi:DNA-binding NtrC family response regulator
MRPLLQGDLPVLLLGETGVGKEQIAHILHASSPRAAGPFVAVNCAAIPADLLESEMFGIARGVASGVSERLGKFQLAQGGTLFLDEIGDMPLDLREAAARCRKRGAPGRQLAPDRHPIVAACNSDLLSGQAGRFRRRLLSIGGYVLRSRRCAAPRGHPALVEAFLQRFSRNRKAVRGVTVKAMKRPSTTAGQRARAGHGCAVWRTSAPARSDRFRDALGHLSAAPARPVLTLRSGTSRC